MSFLARAGNGNKSEPRTTTVTTATCSPTRSTVAITGTMAKATKRTARYAVLSLWVPLVVMVVLMFQMFAGGGTKTIDTKDGFALINQGKATYAEITDNKQVVRLELKNDYTKKNADTGKVTNYGKNVQFYYTFARRTGG